MTTASRQFSLAIGVAAALHGVLFLVAGLLVFWKILHMKPPEDFDLGPEMTAEDLMLMIEPAPPLEIAETKPKLNEAIRFVRTGSSDPSETPPEPGTARFISDRNTKAASEETPDPNGNKNLPSQKGKDLPTLDLANRDFATGEYSTEERPMTGVGQNEGPNQPKPIPPKPEVTPPDLAKMVDAAAKEDAKKMADATKTELESSQPVIDPSSDLVADAPKDKPKEPVMREPKWEKLIPDPPKPKVVADQDTPKQTKPTTQSSGTPGAPRGKDPKAAMAQTVKNEMRGAISNRGKSAVEAADTPMGRYMAKVSAAVSQKFTPACIRARDRVTYGNVSVEFDVNLKGGVENLRIVNDGTSNAILQDLVLGVVLESKIPPIPEELHEYLIGNRLHITYGFLFH